MNVCTVLGGQVQSVQSSGLCPVPCPVLGQLWLPPSLCTLASEWYLLLMAPHGSFVPYCPSQRQMFDVCNCSDCQASPSSGINQAAHWSEIEKEAAAARLERWQGHTASRAGTGTREHLGTPGNTWEDVQLQEESGAGRGGWAGCCSRLGAQL